MKTRVISYIRFSSQRQARGRSEARQADAAKEYCERNGLVLDEHIADLGVSAFRGKNRKKGNLAAFLEQIEAGKVPPGSTLLIEHFDRLSREDIDDADLLVKSILRRDVNIVTLMDGEIYTKKRLNDIKTLMMMVFAFGKAHAESWDKGGRVSSTFTRKKNEGKKVFGAAPGWLKRGPQGKEGDWEVVPELAVSVRKVFEMAAAGMGGPSIARRANSEKWPVPTRVTKNRPDYWHSKMPQIILKNRAVLGEVQHMIRGKHQLDKMGSEVPVADGEPKKDYYPRIIADELWYLAQSAIQSKKTAPRKRDQNYFNVFAGLMRCGHCGAPVQRKSESRGQSRAQLVCTSKLAGLTQCKTASALKTDASILYSICTVAGVHLGLGYDKQATQNEIVVAKAKLAEVAKALENVVALSRATGPIPEVLADIAKLMKQREELENLVEEQNQKLATDPNSMFDTTYAEEVINQLYTVSDESMRLRADCNARLRRAVQVIWLWGYDMAAIDFKHKWSPSSAESGVSKKSAEQKKRDAEDAKKNFRLIVPLESKVAGDARPVWEAGQKEGLKIPNSKNSSVTNEYEY